MISNKNASVKRVPSLITTVFKARDDTPKYAHHAAPAFFNGKYYVSWSAGDIEEDAPGQHAVISESDDFVHWSEPQTLFGKSSLTLTSGGLFADGGTLYAFCGKYDYRPEGIKDGKPALTRNFHCDTSLYMRKFDGKVWSEVEDLHIPFVPNHAPVRMKSGRAVMCGCLSFLTCDGEWDVSKIRRSVLEPYGESLTVDDSGSIIDMKSLRDDGMFLCEASVYETGDRTVALMRSAERRLYMSESTDKCATWSYPVPTEFTDDVSKHCCGTLPDGRIYIVSNPISGICRLPLVISTSEDGETFDKAYIVADEIVPMRYPSLYKGGYYGYPEAIIDNGTMKIACSVNKEDVIVITVALEDIDCK